MKVTQQIQTENKFKALTTHTYYVCKNNSTTRIKLSAHYSQQILDMTV